MPKLVSFIAPLLNKPVERFNWVLDTDKKMSKGGPDNQDKPFVWLKLEAISSFEDPENVRSLTPLLYNFMETDLQLDKVVNTSHTIAAGVYCKFCIFCKFPGRIVFF